MQKMQPEWLKFVLSYSKANILKISFFHAENYYKLMKLSLLYKILKIAIKNQKICVITRFSNNYLQCFKNKPKSILYQWSKKI